MVFPQKYKEIIWRWLLGLEDPEGTSEAWKYVSGVLAPETISRPSVIIFMNWAVDEGLLEYGVRLGKGGKHRVYWTDWDEDEFWAYVDKEVNAALAPFLKGQA